MHADAALDDDGADGRRVEGELASAEGVEQERLLLQPFIDGLGGAVDLEREAGLEVAVDDLKLLLRPIG